MSILENLRVFADDNNLDKLAHLVRGYFAKDGHHVQFRSPKSRNANHFGDSKPLAIVRASRYL